MLPEMDGFEVMYRLEQIPVIFLTSKNALRDRVKDLARNLLFFTVDTQGYTTGIPQMIF